MRRALLALCLLAGACNSAPKDDGTAQPPAPTTAAPTTAAATCEGIGPAPTSDPEITFVADGRLQAVSADGTGLRCLAEGVPAVANASMAWGGAADRVLLPPTSVFLADRKVSADVGPKAIATLSRPTGTSVLAVGNDHKLRKHPIEGGPFTDISFLARTDEAVYHPGGRFIAAVGLDHNGGYGISLATNQGKDARKLADGERAGRIYSLAFSQDGEQLWFLADHGDHGDVHQLDLRTAALTTLSQANKPYARVIASAFTRTQAVTTNKCESLANGLGVQPSGRLAERTLEPVGFLADGRLVVLARASGCSGTGDVHVLGPGSTDPPALARSVESVAIRQPLPPPGELPNAINPAPA
ncbi:MAG: hypothetical protein QOG87_2070 [Actinomycetota bacterium]|jgi:hypothetical protein